MQYARHTLALHFPLLLKLRSLFLVVFSLARLGDRTLAPQGTSARYLALRATVQHSATSTRAQVSAMLVRRARARLVRASVALFNSVV